VPRHRLQLAVVAVALPLAVAACGAPDPGATTAAERPPNLVLVSFDSLRADHLGTYGYRRDTSPNLDRFAARSIVYERAYSTSTWTLPAHASLFSSLYAEEHGARKTDAALSENVVLLPERLAEAGYRSAGVVSVGLLHRTFGFNQGWEIWDDETAVPRGEDPERRRTSAIVGQRAAQLLDELAPGPFLLFVHDYDVHFDYQPPPPYDTMFEPAEAPGFDPSNFAFNETIHRDMPQLHLERLVALYDGEIRWVDHNFGRLLAELERRGLDENTAVVVVGDHGDEFFEHGEKGHANNLFNSTLQVPLIVHLPGGRHGGRRIGTPASLIDVAPTLAALLGVAPPAAAEGRVLRQAGLRIGYVPQQPGSLFFQERLIDELRFTARQRGVRGDHGALLASLGLGWAAERHPRDLSGGERQRAALAAILAGSPKVLILDEPTRGMDPWHRRELLRLLRQVQAEGVAIVMATHDVEMVAGAANRVILLGEGSVVADGPPADVLSDSLTFSTQVNKVLGGAWLTADEVVEALDR